MKRLRSFFYGAAVLIGAGLYIFAPLVLAPMDWWDRWRGREYPPERWPS